MAHARLTDDHIETIRERTLQMMQREGWGVGQVADALGGSRRRLLYSYLEREQGSFGGVALLLACRFPEVGAGIIVWIRNMPYMPINLPLWY